MKLKKSIFYIVSVTVLLALTFGTALADDSVIFRRNISKTPAGETEYASMSFMRFTVPAQAADGTLVDLTLTYETGDNQSPIPIYQDTSTVINTAKPLIASYIDEASVEETLLNGTEIMGGLVIGEFDGFVAHSLDDGATWKTVNVSESAEKSSFFLKNGTAYPGAVYGMVQATIGNRVMAAWLSRYCDEGSPLYTLVGDLNDPADANYLAYLQNDENNLPDLYVTDIWAVAGSQKSVDFTLQGFPEVGEIPYGCVWTARGTLIPTGTATNSSGETVETHDIVWTKPERLTSGVRDPNRLEIDGADGAGFAITWQEDPEGLRPGLGLGPGEGWSGAIVNAKTDIWYSYIDWNDFNLVDEDGDYTTLNLEPVTVEDYFDQNDDGVIDEDLESNKPKVAIPMAMPVRLTDNNMCKASTSSDPTKVSPAYCYVDFDVKDAEGQVDLPDTLPTAPVSGVSDLCTSSTLWETPGGSAINVCQTEDGRFLNGRVGASRARMTLQPYTTNVDENGDGIKDTGAWFIMAYEESKALGEYTLVEGDDTTDPIEIGKNIWYHTFEMHSPELVSQGAMLNQPTRFNPEFAFDTTLGVTDPGLIGAWNGDFLTLTDEWGYTVYQTEIARRFSMIAQPVTKIGQSRTSAYLLYKQGILNQGGPADIFARRIVVPTEAEGFDPAIDNPYAYEHMVCEDDPDTTMVEGWVIEPGLELGEAGYNPNYIQGVCGANATNLSGNTIEALDFSTTECYDPADPTACAAIFPWGGDINDFPKVETWSQSGYDQDGTSSSDPYAEQESYESRNFNSNLNDQSWEDPFDVAKGHRGFLDGDYLYIMYAWSPNWKANSVGNDKYNLYARRSFDGGQTWTTTPGSLGGVGLVSTDSETDDPSLCENYGIGGQEEDITKVCFSYPAGTFEQARNVSQLTGTKITILDPRYTPSGGPKKFTLLESYTTSDGYIYDFEIPAFDYLDDGTLNRDPSKLFVVFETGDNTTAAEGEPTPLDLYYSRGTVYGDYYEWVTQEWEPVEDMAFTIIDEYRWNWLEKDQEDLSGEAALTANPSGDFLYATWSQWQEDEHENVFDSDIWFSRMFYNDEVETLAVVTIENATLLPAMFDTDLEFVLDATAIDYDRFGEGIEIVEYEWSVDSNIRTDISGSRFNAPPRTLSNGWHTFSVRAKDNDGKWSKPAYVRVLIVDEIHNTFLPLMKR